MNYCKDILEHLIEKYEKSKRSIGTNKVNRKCNIKLDKLYPKYFDDSEFDLRQDVNVAISKLIELGFVQANLQRNNTYQEVILLLKEDCLNRSYEFIGKESKSSQNERLKAMFKACSQSGNTILQNYATQQLMRLDNNQNIEFYDNNYLKLKNIIRSVYEIQQLEEETYYRIFSIKLFNDSKYFEKNIKAQVESLLVAYSNFDDKETVLAEFNLIKTPVSIGIKGNIRIYIDDIMIETKSLLGGLGLSTIDIQRITKIEVDDDYIITIENLTNFYSFKSKNSCVVYLGGFSNHIRRLLLQKIYQFNPMKRYLHFGDIDAGGFYILQHLIDKTHIPFEPYLMNIDTLKNHQNNWIELTANDKIRLKKLLSTQYADTVQYMLENNCKLEQESIIYDGDSL